MDLRARTRRIFEELITRGDLTRLDELIAPDYVDPRGPRGRQGFAEGLRAIRSAFPDWSSTPEAILVEGDTVAVLWTVRGKHEGPFLGMPASGRSIEMKECGFLRFVDGRLARIDRVADELGLMRQLGALEVDR